jgi:ATPase subunit of ABC transporter with duplicated ATPase domains
MKTLVHVSEARITTPGGRPLFDGLNMQLSRERVALIGRNGVGKSSLLAVLAGVADVQSGRVKLGGQVHWVPQMMATGSAMDPVRLSHGELSHGEQRKRALVEAFTSGAEILLLDEPTEDLDDETVAWLRHSLKAWPGCLLVASHDRRLLDDFEQFFITSESGCRAYSGTLEGLQIQLERDAEEAQQRYASNLQRLVELEERIEFVGRRRDRKKRRARCSELDRATSRMQLNTKRSSAQVYHGRMKQQREARIDFLRQWTKSTRRALNVNLALELPVPTLPEPGSDEIVVLQGATVEIGGRCIFPPLDLRIGRRRIAVVGPNGAGKTTLLDVMLGRRLPTGGKAFRDLSKIGVIAQGGTDWLIDESLLSYLSQQTVHRDNDELAKLLITHKFPLALAERPLRSLSPGERARAALITLFQRAPAVELLVLDEPTFSLDLVGQRAMTDALRAWPGGLIVASHDRDFLAAIGVEKVIQMN